MLIFFLGDILTTPESYKPDVFGAVKGKSLNSELKCQSLTTQCIKPPSGTSLGPVFGVPDRWPPFLMLFHKGIYKAQVCLSPSSCNSHCSYWEVWKQDQRADQESVFNRKNLEELNLLLGEQDSCPVVCSRVGPKVTSRRNLKSIFRLTLSLEKRYKSKPAPTSGPGTQCRDTRATKGHMHYNNWLGEDYQVIKGYRRGLIWEYL